MGDEIDTGAPATTPAATEGDAAATDDNTILTGAADESGASGDDTGSDDGGTPPADDTATGSDEGQEGGDAGAEGSDTPPDTYADFVMPEGVTLDETALTEATPIFKELGLTQEQAQKLIDFQSKQVQAGSQKQVDNFNQLKSDWLTDAKADGEYGGDKFDENTKIAQNAVNKYGTPELKQLLDDYGVGNHPEVIRFMVRVGHTLTEDVPGTAGGAAAEKSDRVSRMYPKDN